MQKQIALIIPYFGVLPNCFSYFAESVSHSPNVEVLLFTDAKVDRAVYDNIKVYPFTLSDFNRLASHILKMQIAVSFPYKLCDFKPAYGEIFQKYIRDREFWAFGDIDVVHGNLQRFLAPILAANDIVSCRRGWVSGSLCILRNCPIVNSAYTSSVDWQKVFTSPEYQHFDEMGGHFYSEVLNGTDLLELNSEIDSFTHIVRRLAQSGSLRCAFKDLACEHLDWGETLVYDTGKLTRSELGSEVMYVHWVGMKRRFFEVPHIATAPMHFYIRKTGIYTEIPTQPSGWLLEGARVFRGALKGCGRIPGRCFRAVSFRMGSSSGGL